MLSLAPGRSDPKIQNVRLNAQIAKHLFFSSHLLFAVFDSPSLIAGLLQVLVGVAVRGEILRKDHERCLHF